MKIQLSDHFTYRNLLRFVFPSIIMMVFMSIYGVVDGLFISNFVGKTPFAAINLVMPVLMIMGTLGFMVGTGGSAIVSRTLGEGDRNRANQYFSMLVEMTVCGGIALTVLGFILIRPIAFALGAEGEMLENCVLYGRIVLLALTAFLLQSVFQSFFVTAEKPGVGLAVTVIAGITNMVLDALFIAVFDWGVAGAATATAISQIVGGGVPLIYFLKENSSLLHLVWAKPQKQILLKTCTNGSSELMSNVSSSLVSILYNFQLMRLSGEDGVAAYGVIMYVNFIFIAIFLGYSIGSAPIISYHYGAKNHDELKNLFRRSLLLVAVAGGVLTALAEAISLPLTGIFVGYDQQLLSLTCRGFQLYSLSFLFCGLTLFGSGFFTALSDGATSALISFLRVLVFEIVAVLVLPALLGVDGIWLAIVVAEGMALVVTVWFFIRKQGAYHYM